jgi:hypothetical protein
MAKCSLVAAAVVLVIAGCGGGSEQTVTGVVAPNGKVTGDADPGDVKVIQGWATALRKGDVNGAATYFALPSVAQNGLLFHIRTPGEARAFNASLPCGARLVHADRQGNFTIATFSLTERPGAGTCGAGVGQTAKTAFMIRDGKIAQWRRVIGGGSGRPAPSQSA